MMRPMRIRIEESDLKDVIPDSNLHKKIIAQIAQDLLEPYQKKYLDHARKNIQINGELEFDDDAAVSISDDGGAYVMCWKWIRDEEAGIERDQE